MPGSTGGFQWWTRVRSGFDGEAAAWTERAAAVEAGQIGWLPLDRVQAFLARPIQPRNGPQEGHRVRMLGVVVDVGRWSALHQAARVHHVHPGGIARYDPEI